MLKPRDIYTQLGQSSMLEGSASPLRQLKLKLRSTKASEGWFRT